MSAINGRKLGAGLVLIISFLVVLVAIFLPLFDGDNALDTLDNLYNSISKASAYYIPKVRQEVTGGQAARVTVELELGDAELSGRALTLLQSAGATATMEGAAVVINGDLVPMLLAALDDADSVYYNRGDEVSARRDGMEPRAALHAWWKLLGAIERELTRERQFDAAKLIYAVNSRAVECAYNYHGIEPQPIGERWGIVLLSLVFYVVYTVWYGYGVMYLFEGLGYRLTH